MQIYFTFLKSYLWYYLTNTSNKYDQIKQKVVSSKESPHVGEISYMNYMTFLLNYPNHMLYGQHFSNAAVLLGFVVTADTCVSSWGSNSCRAGSAQYPTLRSFFFFKASQLHTSDAVFHFDTQCSTMSSSI